MDVKECCESGGDWICSPLPDGTTPATQWNWDWSEFVVVSANVSFVLALRGC